MICQLLKLLKTIIPQSHGITHTHNIKSHAYTHCHILLFLTHYLSHNMTLKLPGTFILGSANRSNQIMHSTVNGKHDIKLTFVTGVTF